MTDANENGQRAQLLALVPVTAGFWHDQNRNGGITIGQQHFLIESEAFEGWLQHRYWQAHKSAPGQKALKEALDNLNARARFDGQRTESWIRTGWQGGKVYIDLGRADWRMLEIGADGWRIAHNPAVKMVRPPQMKPLPEPLRGGSLKAIESCLNLGGGNQTTLLVAFLLQALFPKGPFPLLVVNGEQGSGKSFLCKMIGELVDPCESASRTMPKKEEDLIIAASNRHLLVFDNLSFLPDELSDALCRLATGTGLTKRKLYSNFTEATISTSRPVVLNGITDFVERPDLMDRAILLSLPTISQGLRDDEETLWGHFRAGQASMLGALCDGLACALANRDKVHLPEKPRMADFAKLVTAAEPAFCWQPGTFMEAYRKMQDEMLLFALSQHPLGHAVCDLMEQCERVHEEPTALLELLRQRVSPETARLSAFPKAANHLTRALRRMAPQFRKAGIECHMSHSGRRHITLERFETAVHTVLPSEI